MRNKKVNVAIIVIFILIIVGCFYYIFRDSISNSIKLGLDLNGGTQLILKPIEEETGEITEEKLEYTIGIIRDRVDKLGVSEPLITKDNFNNIIVQLPGVEDPDNAKKIIGKTARLEFRLVEGTFVSRKGNSWDIVEFDYQNGELLIDPEAEETILIEDVNKFFQGESVPSTGRLATNPENNALVLLYPQSQDESDESINESNADEPEFNPEEIMGTLEYNNDTNEMFLVKDGEEIGEILIDSRTGAATLVGPALITGDELANAVAGYDNYGNIRVGLSFKEEADDTFAEITTNNIGRNLAIALDEEIESAPYIRVPITDGEAEITGITSIEEAKNIELVLQTGAFPIDLHLEESIYVGPTLGMDSLRYGLYAGITGLILIIAFMFFYYKGLGIYSMVGLLVYIIIFWGVISAIGAPITLPGIAGIILTIGMAVDANVIIFERIKEEILKEKSPRAAISEGFKGALRTIIDSNITTLVAAGALYFFGEGPIKGFAVTLSLGVIISMVVSLLFTRSGIFLMSGIPKMTTHSFLGLARRSGE